MSWSEAARGFGGQISDFPLTSVLQILELGKKSGFLYVRSFPKVAFLVFREGAIVQAVSSLRRVGLGEMLISEGFIKKADLELALETQKRAPKKQMLGEIFEQLGHVSHKQIVEAMTNQMKEIVRWSLKWEQGEFTFYSGKESKSDAPTDDEEMVLPVGLVVEEVLRESIQDRDRRQYARVPVSLKVVRNIEGVAYTYYTRDVSGGGVFVLCDDLPKMGELMDLDLWIPTFIAPPTARCRVVRVGDGKTEARGYAVQFEQVDSEARSVLERLGGALSTVL